MMRVAIALLLLMLVPDVASAEKRVALVIGNSAYKHAPELVNPKNDADDIAGALKALGIEVIKGLDLDKQRMEREVRKFSTALSGADVGIFFYSGHGLQVNGNNYLVPVDAALSTTDALEFEMVRLDLVQRLMEGGAKTNILFLDACRNNPLSRNLARAMGTRSAAIGKGLAPAESGVGTLISFSTQPGNVALDGTGRNSPYTGPLVKRIGRQGEDVLTVLTDVRNEVLAATGEKQVPWENHALRARFYFNVAPIVTPSIPRVNEAERAWRWVKDTVSVAVLENFIKEFGDTEFAANARLRIEELKREPVGGAATASTVASNAQRPALKDPKPFPRAVVESYTRALLGDARAIKSGGPRAEALTRVAFAQAKAGLASESAFAEALASARSIKDENERELSLSSVADARADLGQIAQALQIARGIKDDYLRGSSLKSISIAHAKAGDIVKAKELANSIGSASHAVDALVEIAKLEKKAGKPHAFVMRTFSEALRAAQNTTDDFWQPMALNAVAHAYADIGQTAAALEVAKTNKRAQYRGFVLTNLAGSLDENPRKLTSNEIEEATKLSQSIDDGLEKTKALARIAVLMVIAGQTAAAAEMAQKAFSAVQSLAGVNGTDDALKEIATAFALAGRLAEAKRTTESIKDIKVRRSHFDIPGKLAWIGQLQQAVEFSDLIEDPGVRARALTSVVEFQVRRGMADEAMATIRNALQAAQSGSDPTDRSEVFAEIASAQRLAGLSTEAENALQSATQAMRLIKDESNRAAAISGVTFALVE